MTAKSPTCQPPLQEFHGVHSSYMDIVGQLEDIDPSRLSLSPFIDLDTQISLSPISDSPESSVEELHSTKDEDAQEDTQKDCSLVSVGIPQVLAADQMGQLQIPVAEENPSAPETSKGTHNGVEGVAIQDKVQTVEVTIPDEISLVDTVQPLSGSPQKSAVQQSAAVEDGAQSIVITIPDENSFPNTVQSPSGNPRKPVTQQEYHEHQLFLEAKDLNPIPHHDSGGTFPRSHCHGCSSDHMKAVASAFVAVLFIPVFLYVCYYYAPLEVPACPDLSSRITFALRSLLMASIPIILGIAFRSIAALCQASLDPLQISSQTLLRHQLFVTASMDQFAIFGLNLLVTATYFPEEHLRLIPILAGLFFISRFCYWVALLHCSCYRSFGFGLTFFPTLCMTAYSFYCLCDVGFGFLFQPVSLDYGHSTAAPVSPKETVYN